MRAAYLGFDTRTYPQWLDLTEPAAPRALVAVPGGTYEVYPTSGLLDAYHEALEAASPGSATPTEPSLPADGLWQAVEEAAGASASAEAASPAAPALATLHLPESEPESEAH